MTSNFLTPQETADLSPVLSLLGAILIPIVVRLLHSAKCPQILTILTTLMLTTLVTLALATTHCPDCPDGLPQVPTAAHKNINSNP